ncbi:hypothetical protein [Streptomyces sp. NPDC057545]|uniref:hypothetical protein n=1 Tax=Streptomyces sp. NPDC057545 TaxID=3346164 RepID=UPI003698F4D0
MAPERWQGAESDGRADLFPLGVTLYEALEGVLPFRPENPTAALTEEPRPMERAGALAPLLLALLEKDPARRPTVDSARKLLTPPSRPPERKTKPWEQVPPGDSVTVANKQGEIAWFYSLTAGKIGGYAGFGIGGFLGALIFPDPVLSLGSLELVDGDNRLGNAALGAAVLYGLLGFICCLVGLIAGARSKSDVVTLSAHGLTISSWRGYQQRRLAEDGTLEPHEAKTFTLRWDALERIAVEYPEETEPAAIAVWFRPGRWRFPEQIRSAGSRSGAGVRRQIPAWCGC